MKTQVSVFPYKVVSVAVLTIVPLLIAPVASRAAETSTSVDQPSVSPAPQAKTAEPDYVTFNVEFNNEAGAVPLLFQLEATRCVIGNFPHVQTVNPGQTPSFTMKTVNTGRCQNVNKYLMWNVTPKTGAQTKPYRVKFIHGSNPDWGTTISVDGNIPTSGAVQTATCNGKNCLNPQWFFGTSETFVIITFH